MLCCLVDYDSDLDGNNDDDNNDNDINNDDNDYNGNNDDDDSDNGAAVAADDANNDSSNYMNNDTGKWKSRFLAFLSLYCSKLSCMLAHMADFQLCANHVQHIGLVKVQHIMCHEVQRQQLICYVC